MDIVLKIPKYQIEEIVNDYVKRTYKIGDPPIRQKSMSTLDWEEDGSITIRETVTPRTSDSSYKMQLWDSSPSDEEE